LNGRALNDGFTALNSVAAMSILLGVAERAGSAVIVGCASDDKAALALAR
jgi:hypothetical protein